MTKPPSPPFIASPHFYSGGNKPVRWIVVHCTISPCERGGARHIARYFANGGLSAHYVVDPTETVQCVHDWDRAWHCGSPGNTRSIGVEQCAYVPPHGSWHDGPHEAMLRRSAALVSQLCEAYGVPKRKLSPHEVGQYESGICGHWDITRGVGGTTHTDPGSAFPWKHYMKLVHDGGDDMPSVADVWGHKVDDPTRYPKDHGGKTSDDNIPIEEMIRRIYKAVDELPLDVWHRDGAVDVPEGQGSPDNREWSASNAMSYVWRLAATAAKGRADVDESAIAEQVLEGLTPAAIADAVVAEMGAEQAGQVVDELGRRLGAG